MEAVPLRISPDMDLRTALESSVASRGCRAAFVVSGIGSLGHAQLRLAGTHEPIVLDGDREILTLAGTVSADGSHVHMSVADAAGQVLGGHVASDCIVRTTVEVLLVLLPEWSFTRELDPATGFAELLVRPSGQSGRRS
jgi:uncharacterized protein